MPVPSGVSDGCLSTKRQLGHRQCNAGLFSFISLKTGDVAVENERMLKWFKFDHLPEPLKEVSSHFAELANITVALCASGPERTVALRKLLEAKDAAVRARLNPGG